ncbi:hypothetical protein VD0002_g8162 [Verticillium dahliae]|uniref:Glycoside hydrolase n=2 Tax=Verticillium dahliae TaxID=27337 RepID=G2WV24_VERDV|nr:glycoside hydrolase [Verticillium dahliae VdLs.17]KAF3349882.1 Cell cycle serine/threonine-protein kinase hsk1 [Verticillium dahliae VDG2]PNH30892.1 hypothetical protein BJF96_g5770 [Verticillium dahliae]EGY20149.1 glycoside hydrolase [Verticillium dahliae VdLs.17]PNH37889.1 hypothetical protein VD0004_g8908 [Verticillium dahliae]PNH46838.1 hypothetical protein VD0003_g8944 [Verticillium dahliae]
MKYSFRSSVCLYHGNWLSFGVSSSSGTSGSTWSTIASCFADITYVGRVAAAGKQHYNIPFHTNCWLNFDDSSELDTRDFPLVVGGGAAPGDYPSGGPCPHVLDIWRHNTPALDFLVPDLYFHHYESVLARVCATYGALGTGPFGIDTGAEGFGRKYKLLAQTQEHLLAAGPADRFGFFFDEEPSPGSTERWTKVIGDFEVIVEWCFVFGKQSSGAGMVIHKGNGKFLAVGRGFHVYFKSVRPEATFTGILHAEEKEVTETGELRTLRVFNGDETRSGEFLMMPNDDPDYGGFPIAVTIPARTCIAELEAYWFAEAEEDR